MILVVCLMILIALLLPGVITFLFSLALKKTKRDSIERGVALFFSGLILFSDVESIQKLWNIICEQSGGDVALLSRVVHVVVFIAILSALFLVMALVILQLTKITRFLSANR